MVIFVLVIAVILFTIRMSGVVSYIFRDFEDCRTQITKKHLVNPEAVCFNLMR